MIDKCQVFTPTEHVKTLLDYIGYRDNLFNIKIMENSCGDGNFLIEIVDRYIKDCRNNKMSADSIINGLENDIYGNEIDDDHLNNCIEKLNNLVEKYNLKNINWNIKNRNTLIENDTDKYDFVVGNPPYIAYNELLEDEREFLREKFNYCKHGKFDYCYAFIESSIKSLKINGKLGYIIPTNIFKVESATILRNDIKNHITHIYDYQNIKLFDKKLTSSAMIICIKDSFSKNIAYQEIEKNETKIISINNLNYKWNFHNEKDNMLIKRRFGDYFNASIVVATLCNEAFILKNYIKEDGYYSNGVNRIEAQIVKKTISPRSYNKNEYIIFPYQYVDNILQRYDEEAFQVNFPFATEYLKKYDKKLADRKKHDNIKWFEYGRMQALKYLNQRKLLLSTIITNTVKIIDLSAEVIPYSGIYITPINDMALELAKTVLTSDEFYDYVQNIGVKANGASYRISPKDINNYKF